MARCDHDKGYDIYFLASHMKFEWITVCLDTAYFTESWKLKIENWKYYNKIIFKYVNSTVRLIFNEIFVEKKRFVSLMNNAQDPLKLS